MMFCFTRQDQVSPTLTELMETFQLIVLLYLDVVYILRVLFGFIRV